MTHKIVDELDLVAAGVRGELVTTRIPGYPAESAQLASVREEIKRVLVEARPALREARGQAAKQKKILASAARSLDGCQSVIDQVRESLIDYRIDALEKVVAVVRRELAREAGQREADPLAQLARKEISVDEFKAGGGYATG